ncbi:MAG: hypothetical protein JNN08_18115 [Bryobacterales bacterium]|nr:hypothetical protein [Bryobacterales bacterium]
MRTLLPLVLGVCSLAATPALAGEKGLMHCFAFTVIESATEADWAAFNKATDDMPKKNKAVKKVWHGKLRAPLTQFRGDAETRKKITKDAKSVSGTFDILRRQHGVCMLMDDEASLKVYTQNPYHKEWMAAYEKVRVAGTTTYDILAQ